MQLEKFCICGIILATEFEKSNDIHNIHTLKKQQTKQRQKKKHWLSWFTELTSSHIFLVYRTIPSFSHGLGKNEAFNLEFHITHQMVPVFFSLKPMFRGLLKLQLDTNHLVVKEKFKYKH